MRFRVGSEAFEGALSFQNVGALSTDAVPLAGGFGGYAARRSANKHRRWFGTGSVCSTYSFLPCSRRQGSFLSFCLFLEPGVALLQHSAGLCAPTSLEQEFCSASREPRAGGMHCATAALFMLGALAQCSKQQAVLAARPTAFLQTSQCRAIHPPIPHLAQSPLDPPSHLNRIPSSSPIIPPHHTPLQQSLPPIHPHSSLVPLLNMQRDPGLPPLAQIVQ